MKTLRLLLVIFGLGFLLNLVWENLQAPLYSGYANFWNHFWICFWASLVDALVILLLYCLFAAWYSDFYWIESMNLASAITLIMMGGLIAVGFEYWAFETETWTYTESMPVVPYLQTGLSPLLQMMLLPALTFIVARKLIKSQKLY